MPTCTPQSPCNGRPYRFDAAVSLSHDNLTGAQRYVCTALTCTRDQWIHPEPLAVRERPSSTAERILAGLNEEEHYCEECDAPYTRNSSTHVLCVACSGSREVARKRRWRAKTDGVRPPCDICGKSLTGEYARRLRHAGACDQEKRRRYQVAWNKAHPDRASGKAYLTRGRPSTTQRGKATGGGIRVAHEVAMAGLGK